MTSVMADLRRRALLESWLLRVELWHPNVPPKTRRAIAGRLAAPKPDMCPHGHPFTHANTYRDADGDRNCRECRRQATARWRATRKASADPTLPYEPLRAAVCRYDRLLPVDTISMRRVALLCHAPTSRVTSWIRTGRISINDADRAALTLGMHPAEIWPEWIEVAS